MRDAAVDAVRAAAAGPSEAPADAIDERCRVAVLFALSQEAAGLVEKLRGVVSWQGSGFTAHVGGLHGEPIVVAVTGPGERAVINAVEAIVQGHRPDWVVSAGFAGGLANGVARMNLVVANEIVTPGGDGLPVDVLPVDVPLDPLEWRHVGRLHVGRLVTVPAIVATPLEKHKLAIDTGAVAVDMESFHVAAICRRENLRFLAVRVISDAVDDALPAEVDHLLKQRTVAGQLGAITGALFRRPSSLKDLWSLQETAVQASDQLAKFLAELLPLLPAAPKKANDQQ